MHLNSTRDLLTDFSDYGYNQLSSLVSPQNSITSRPSKRPPIHLRESLIGKPKGKVTNKLISIAPAGSNSERARLDNSTTHTAPNRNETLRIFQNKFEKTKFSEEVPPVKKRTLEGRIKYHDTVKTIEAMVKEAQKEYLTKKKKGNKGTMLVNDLWGQVYQKEVIKQSGMEQTPKQKHKTEISQNFQQLNLTDRSLEETSKTPKNNIVPVLTQMPFVNETVSKINVDTSYLQNSARSFRVPDTPKKISSDPFPQKTRKNHISRNVWNPNRQNCSSVLRGSTHIINQSLVSRFNHHYSSSKKETSAEIERSAMTMRDKSREDSLDTYRNAFQRLIETKSPDYSFTSRLPLKETYESTLRQRRTRKEQKDYFSSFQNEKTSPRNLSENSTKEIEAAKTRLYLAGKNAQLTEILGDCEFELQEKGEVTGMIQDLQELFVNRKYNREKQLELEQQEKLLDECKFLFKDKLSRKY